jgi:predicted DNA-binding transcriptional regulator YafY
MRADRLLSALLLLQAHGKQTGRELATRLEVSERTVHRDMDALSAAGIPVVALRGARGGWHLDDGWRTKVPALDEVELRALLMAQPRMVGDRNLAAAAERAIDKLMAALPVSMRAQAASMRQRLHVDSDGWWESSAELDAMPIVQDAVSRDRKLSFRYRGSSGEVVDRTVDPLGLVAKGATWYLAAQTPAGLRTYRVSRIEQAQLLDAPCVRPPGFDLAEYWKASTAHFMETRSQYRATLRLHPQAVGRVRFWRMCAATDASDDVDRDGWTTLELRFEDEEQARFVALGFGPKAQVIAPDSLRQRVNDDLAAMVVTPASPRLRAAVLENVG